MRLFLRKLMKRHFGVRRTMKAGQLYPGLVLLLSWSRWGKVEKVTLHSGVRVTIQMVYWGEEELAREDEVEVLREST